MKTKTVDIQQIVTGRLSELRCENLPAPVRERIVRKKKTGTGTVSMGCLKKPMYGEKGTSIFDLGRRLKQSSY
jgi:hypothetical protein